jgi:hypothetical protein
VNGKRELRDSRMEVCCEKEGGELHGVGGVLYCHIKTEGGGGLDVENAYNQRKCSCRWNLQTEYQWLQP